MFIARKGFKFFVGSHWTKRQGTKIKAVKKPRNTFERHRA